MKEAPTVSVIMPFLDEERFIREAIDSVLRQPFGDWELLLVDDGSTDGSSAIAQGFSAQQPSKIRYLNHPGHVNKGSSASRNLALAHARGNYIAQLDADDVWLESKLATQVPQLDQAPDVGMLYCTTRYWYSWTRDTADLHRDSLYQPVQSDTVYDPPRLLKDFLVGKTLMPCVGSTLVRREALVACGGWDDSFRNLYDDQVLFAKLCLSTRIMVRPECHDLYRQHEDSTCAIGYRTDGEAKARYHFHEWLADYLASHPLCDGELWSTVERKRARSRQKLPSGTR